MKNTLNIINKLIMTLALLLTFNSPLLAQSHIATQSLAPVLKKVLPSVVNIAVLGQITHPSSTSSKNNNPYQPQTGRKFQSVGSGVIIDSKHGYIITNAHVVKDAKVIVIILQDGRQLSATKIGDDPESDIALLHVKDTHLTAIEYGQSEQLAVGDFVAAIGNPYGLHHSVTSGMVSALHRNDLHIEGYEDFIQTDAPINPGNSGGALINMQGKLIGMNTAIIGPDGANVGIGFAIPSDMIRSVVQQLIKHGKVERGLIGVVVQSLTPSLATALHTSLLKGAIVTELEPGSPAQKAGIQVQDIIVKANHNVISSPATLRNAIGLTPIDQNVTLHIEHNHKMISKSIHPIPFKTMKAIKEHHNNPLTGVQMAAIDELTPSGRQIRGILTIGLNYTSQAWFSGLRTGDIIMQVNHQNVTSVKQLWAITQASHKDLLLKVHHDADRYIVIHQG